VRWERASGGAEDTIKKMDMMVFSCTLSIASGNQIDLNTDEPFRTLV